MLPNRDRGTQTGQGVRKTPVFGGGKQALTAIHFLTAPIAMLHHQEHLPVAFGRNHMTLRDGECEYAAYGNVESEINSEQLHEATFNDNNKNHNRTVWEYFFRLRAQQLTLNEQVRYVRE